MANRVRSETKERMWREQVSAWQQSGVTCPRLNCGRTFCQINAVANPVTLCPDSRIAAQTGEGVAVRKVPRWAWFLN